MKNGSVLKIENLRTYFFSRSKQAFSRAADGVDLELEKGQTLGIVGESGSGKSVTALSVMGLVTAEPGIISGNIGLKTDAVQKNLLQDVDDYVKLSSNNGRIVGVAKDNSGWQRHMDRVLRGVRGKEISMIFQNPKLAMNPFSRVGQQITEAILLNTSTVNRREARERSLYWLEQVKIDSPRLRYDNYPNSLSGGMCQRAMIAMALSMEPSVLIADEPTTGLDATIQSKIVNLLGELKSNLGITTLLISHDIDVIKTLSDRVAVMYGGRVLEAGPANEILAADQLNTHPYTAALIASIPTVQQIRDKTDLRAINGDVVDTVNLPPGCRFYDRCRRMTEQIRTRCENQEPAMSRVSPNHQVRCWRYFEG
ncbi:MAG: ABC transporter ATP-binding protein [Desulfobacterales bacterium]|nr:ABC transporter ATP-binding protein [Desulfobacterales bacterium]